jgi:hypothetical protein
MEISLASANTILKFIKQFTLYVRIAIALTYTNNKL